MCLGTKNEYNGQSIVKLITHNVKVMNIIRKYLAKRKAKPKGTVASFATLCIVCTVFLAALFAGGCNERENVSEVDAETFLANLKSSPFVYVPEEGRPDWLNEWIELASSDLLEIMTLVPGSILEVHRGKWDGQTVYNVWSVYTYTSFLDIRNEKGDRLNETLGILGAPFGKNDFFSKSNGWELIFQIKDGAVTTTGVKSAFSIKERALSAIP